MMRNEIYWVVLLLVITNCYQILNYLNGHHNFLLLTFIIGEFCLANIIHGKQFPNNSSIFFYFPIEQYFFCLLRFYVNLKALNFAVSGKVTENVALVNAYEMI